MNSAIIDKLAKSFKYRTLDYKHAVRKHLADNSINVTVEEADFLIPLATSCFDYYNKYKSSIHDDISLRTITSMCNFKELITDVAIKDRTVTYLSHLFNRIINSSRGLYECYDCGTNARALFLKLIGSHRALNPLVAAANSYNPVLLTRSEMAYMKQMYIPSSINPAGKMRECIEHIKRVKRSTAYIMSIGLGDSGHVWVIDVIVAKDGKRRYHMYQSCLNAYLVLDYFEYKKYGEYPDQSMDIEEFAHDLGVILDHTRPWTEQIKKLFAKHFMFLPGYDVEHHENSFCWTYVTY